MKELNVLEERYKELNDKRDKALSTLNYSRDTVAFIIDNELTGVKSSMDQLEERTLVRVQDEYDDFVRGRDEFLGDILNNNSIMKSVMDRHISDLGTEVEGIKKEISTLRDNCTNKDFLTSFSNDAGIINFISTYVGVSVTSDDIVEAINRRLVKSLSSEPTVRGSNQISTDDFNRLIGNPVFEIDSSSYKSKRVPTKSDNYVTYYNSNTDSYTMKTLSSDEVINEFTLADYKAGKKFRNKDGEMETLRTLGINIFSLRGMTTRNNKYLADRVGADYIITSSGRGYYSFIPFDFGDDVSYLTTRFATNKELLKGFFTAMINMGYGDMLRRYFHSVVEAVKKADVNNSLFNYIIFTTQKPNLKSGCYGILHASDEYMCLSSSLYLERKHVFEIMILSLECIAKYLDIEVDSLLKLVRFYGGHDYIAQGSDLNNFFNSRQEACKDRSTRNINPLDMGNNAPSNVGIGVSDEDLDVDKKTGVNCDAYLTKFRADNLDYIRQFGRKEYKPIRINFNYKGKTHTLNLKDINKYRTTNTNPFISPADFILFVVEVLMKDGMTIKDICASNIKCFGKDCLSTEKPSGRVSSIQVGEHVWYGIYYCVSWKALRISIEKFLNHVGVSANCLEFYCE